MPDAAWIAKLLVTDTGPLITLAVADSLACLLYPAVPVHIPDAVLYEATVKSGSLGAENIVLWMQEHPDAVRPIVTQTYVNFQTLRSHNPLHRERDLGERAALEAIRYGIPLASEERAVLLTEDDRAATVLVLPDDRQRLITMTTFDFLTGLELAGRIQSAEAIYRLAADAGRNAARIAVLQAQHERAQQAVDHLLRQKS
ncbi:MAG: hypothetical protein HQL87_13050 [Magnetococcales bacterium]|nr:hypothetical protein [Magnetococcales bacterium]